MGFDSGYFFFSAKQEDNPIFQEQENELFELAKKVFYNHDNNILGLKPKITDSLKEINSQLNTENFTPYNTLKLLLSQYI